MTPFINKSYFKEVFEKYKDKLKCEVELTSTDDDQADPRNQGGQSEDQEANEIEENKYLIEQRKSSKNSRASSQKNSKGSNKSSQKDSVESAEENQNLNE